MEGEFDRRKQAQLRELITHVRADVQAAEARLGGGGRSPHDRSPNRIRLSVTDQSSEKLANQAFLTAFREYGIDLEKLDPWKRAGGSRRGASPEISWRPSTTLRPFKAVGGVRKIIADSSRSPMRQTPMAGGPVCATPSSRRIWTSCDDLLTRPTSTRRRRSTSSAWRSRVRTGRPAAGSRPVPSLQQRYPGDRAGPTCSWREISNCSALRFMPKRLDLLTAAAGRSAGKSNGTNPARPHPCRHRQALRSHRELPDRHQAQA